MTIDSPLISLIIYGVALYAAALAACYWLASAKVFKTEGHKSSEFKLALFCQVNGVIILLAGFLHGATTPWLAIAVIAYMALTAWRYTDGRARIKTNALEKP